jgi:Zn-dependent protease with chaperone function
MEKPVYRNERPLLFIAFVLSTLFWGALVWFTHGGLLVILPIMFILYLFGQSALVCHLKGAGALISDSQYPDIQKRVQFCRERTGLKYDPRVYIMNGNGVFNAFATGFLRKKYIVLLSEIIDGVEDKPDAMNFIIGHEMGHLDRKHLLYATYLSPALCLPLLGAAYSRAREYTCDGYGTLCCTPESAQQGLALLAVGPRRFKTINMTEYLSQMRDTSGFWMSFHELIAGYPWLIKRCARVSPEAAMNIPRRNLFAYLFAAFIPRLNILSLIIIYFFFIGMAMKGKMPGEMFMQGLYAHQPHYQQSNMGDYEVGKKYMRGDDQHLETYLGGDPNDETSWEK